MISVSILGLIMAAVTGAIYVGVNQVRATDVRLSESNDLQLAASPLSADVSGANAMISGVDDRRRGLTPTAPRCGTDPAANVVLELLGASFNPTALPSIPSSASPAPTVWPTAYLVTYVKRTTTVGGKPSVELHRLTCTTSNPQTVPSDDRVMGRLLSTTSPPDVYCFGPAVVPAVVESGGTFTVTNSIRCATPTAALVMLTLAPRSGDATLKTRLMAHRRPS